MHKGFLITASILGALSVVLGAFGAHALKRTVGEDAVQIFETGVRYQFYHVFALALAGILYSQFTNNFTTWAGYCFIAGILFFSGSLYVLTYAKAINSSSFNWAGPITPVGGLFFIAGWVLLAVSITK